MAVIVILIFISLLIGIVFLFLFVWSHRSGQFEDIDGAAVRFLFEDDEQKTEQESKKTQKHDKNQ